MVVRITWKDSVLLFYHKFVCFLIIENGISLICALFLAVCVAISHQSATHSASIMLCLTETVGQSS